MSLPISPVAPVRLPEISMPQGVPAGTGGPGEFQSMFSAAIGGVERMRSAADQSAVRFLAGEGEEVHTVALAAQRAELAFETFVQVRNKVVSAYQSIMQMQV